MRRLPPLHSLRAFEAAARHLHFGKAAEELHLDPTAISHQVRKLEELIGVTLFYRRPRPLRLTEAGESLYPVLRDSMDQMAAAIADLATDASKPLVVSMTMGFATEWFTPRLSRLQAETGMEIAVHAENRPVNLHAGQADLAIRTQVQPEPADVWQHLFDDRLIAVASPALLARHGEPRQEQDLLGFPLIHYRWTAKSREKFGWQAWFKSRRIDPGRLMIAGDFSEESHAIQAALSGLGVALLSEFLIRDRVARGELIQVADHHLLVPAVWAVSAESHPRRTELDLLIRLIKALNTG
tara:strand:- start:45 stop:935 length:891 start_codon:yes stop_codon:yes gene_type:complete